MKKNIFPKLIVIVFLVCLGITNIFAQEDKKEFIQIEIKIDVEFFSHIAKVPIINQSFDDRNSFQKVDEIYLGNFATVDCLNCILSSQYQIFSVASRLDENSFKVVFDMKFTKKAKCNIENKSFVLKLGKRKNFTNKCGVKISAYYE